MLAYRGLVCNKAVRNIYCEKKSPVLSSDESGDFSCVKEGMMGDATNG